MFRFYTLYKMIMMTTMMMIRISWNCQYAKNVGDVNVCRRLQMTLQSRRTSWSVQEQCISVNQASQWWCPVLPTANRVRPSPGKRSCTNVVVLSEMCVRFLWISVDHIRSYVLILLNCSIAKFCGPFRPARFRLLWFVCRSYLGKNKIWINEGTNKKNKIHEK